MRTKLSFRLHPLRLLRLRLHPVLDTCLFFSVSGFSSTAISLWLRRPCGRGRASDTHQKKSRNNLNGKGATSHGSKVAPAGWLSALLRRCGPSSALRPGQQAHAQAVARGILPHATLETDLVLVYCRCAVLSAARKLFDRMPHRNAHTWNILLSSYVQSSLFALALSLLRPFLDSGLRPDHYTLPSLLKAAAATGDASLGTLFHGWAVRLGHQDDIIVRSSVLDMYAKCGFLDDALSMFDTMPTRDIVLWNSIISAFARAGFSVKAMDLFRMSQSETMDMDSRAIPSILNACGKEGDLTSGKEVHGRMIRSLIFDSDIAIGNSLIDMYSKCGLIDASDKVFLSMRERNLVTWSTLISSYGVHGKGKESLRLFKVMIEQGMKPNCITFTSILSSCTHSGLVNEGQKIFESMREVHGIDPGVEHYACMVDLIGRSGNIKEALETIKMMPMEPAASVWGALLGACVMHKNAEVGEVAANRLFELEAENPSNYVALCGIYESIGCLHGVAKMRARMRELGMLKTPGCSWIDMKGTLHAFYQGHASHPLSKEIYEMLHVVAKQMATSRGHYG